MTNLKNFVTEVKQNNGGTYSFNVPLPQRGYFVSIEGKELKMELSKINDNVLQKFIFDNSELLSQEKYFLGAWIDAGYIYLDVSKHFKLIDFALNFGEQNNQLAIFDIAKKESIYLTEKITA